MVIFMGFSYIFMGLKNHPEMMNFMDFSSPFHQEKWGFNHQKYDGMSWDNPWKHVNSANSYKISTKWSWMNGKNGMFKRSNENRLLKIREICDWIILEHGHFGQRIQLGHGNSAQMRPQLPRIPGLIHSNSQNKAQNQNGMVFFETKKNYIT